MRNITQDMLTIKRGHCTDHLVSAVPHGAALATDDGGSGEPLRELLGEVQRKREDQVLSRMLLIHQKWIIF